MGAGPRASKTLVKEEAITSMFAIIPLPLVAYVILEINWIMEPQTPWWLLSIPTYSSNFPVPTNTGVWIVPAVVHCHASIKNRAARRVPDEKDEGEEHGEEAEHSSLHYVSQGLILEQV